MAVAFVEAAAPAASQPTRKRVRVAMGTTDDYAEEACCLGAGAFGAVVRARHRSI
jgi:cell division cycle 2-like protein